MTDPRIGRGLALAGFLALAPGLAEAERCELELRPLVEAKMTELGVPGAIIFVDAPGSCQWTATLGTGDVTKRRPMQLDDHVRVGSISKTFTGTVILQLVDEGKIGLDDSISRHSSGVPNGDAITVRQLLNMSSGLYNYSEDPAFNQSLDKSPQKKWMPAELLSIALARPPYFAPGAGFHYSNTNTLLLGLMVEKITGKSLAEELDRRVFRPLRMTQTSLPGDASIPEPHPRGYMFGSNVGTMAPACDARSFGRHDVTDVSPSWTWAAGGVISTLADLRIWARALALGTLLTPATQAQRLRFIATGPAAGAPRYGAQITSFGGVIGHDGNLPGFSSFIGYIPAKETTLVVLANVYTDRDCAGPSDALVRTIGKKLQLFSP